MAVHAIYPLERYLARCEIIDFGSSAVAKQAAKLADENRLSTAKRCFVFVRDEIEHSSDYRRNPVTCSASQVLRHRTGYCYAKSHLLCALLRANEIPAGLCYQRLSIDGLGPPFCLHGLVAVHLPSTCPDNGGWFRIDPRGNRNDVDARFTPPIERLAFAPQLPGEYDLPGIHAEPLPAVVNALRKHKSWIKMLANLPDDDMQ